MEKKKMQRIIGILVVIALVIVLLPLFIDKNDSQIQTASVTSPPFPNENQTKPTTELSDPDVSLTEQKPNEAVNITPRITANVKESTSNITNAVQPAITPVAKKASPEQHPEVLANTVTPINANADQAKIETAAKSDKQEPVTKKEDNKTTKHADASKDNKNLHKTAWVVQMGSFKEKNNARHLADKLRSAGFKAFMRSVKSSYGERTRVYIGPEFKAADAESLSAKIEQQMKMHGIVVHFKPLEL